MNKGGGYMNILKVVTLVTAVVLALAAQGSAGVAASDYTVPSTTDEPGLNTGLVLTKGLVTVTATGSVCPNTGYCVGPDGMSSVNTKQSDYGGFVLSGAPGYGLVGRVGNGGWVQVGDGPTKLRGSGELVFAVNDDLFSDNSGGFIVTVSYKESDVSRTCWPGWGYGDDNHVHCGPPGLANKPEQGATNEHGKSEEEHGTSEDKGDPKK